MNYSRTGIVDVMIGDELYLTELEKGNKDYAKFIFAGQFQDSTVQVKFQNTHYGSTEAIIDIYPKGETPYFELKGEDIFGNGTEDVISKEFGCDTASYYFNHILVRTGADGYYGEVHVFKSQKYALIILADYNSNPHFKREILAALKIKQ